MSAKMSLDINYDSGLKIADGALKMIKDILANLNAGTINVSAKPTH
jgi:hypothetical protein